MRAGRKAPVIAIEILDHLGAFKRQPTRADTAGENDHRCQKRSKRRRLHVRAAGARPPGCRAPSYFLDRISAPRGQEEVNKLAWSRSGVSPISVAHGTTQGTHRVAANGAGQPRSKNLAATSEQNRLGRIHDIRRATERLGQGRSVGAWGCVVCPPSPSTR